MFYVIETVYVGPNETDERYIDTHSFEISTRPAVGNLDHEPRTSGWCGTTNDWSIDAHGEFATQEAAENWIKEYLADIGCREDDMEDDDDPFDSDVVARYLPGRYAPLTPEHTQDWVNPALDEVTRDTTDDEISVMVAQLVEDCRDEMELDPHVDTLREEIEDRRQEQRDELEDSE